MKIKMHKDTIWTYEGTWHWGEDSSIRSTNLKYKKDNLGYPNTKTFIGYYKTSHDPRKVGHLILTEEVTSNALTKSTSV